MSIVKYQDLQVGYSWDSLIEFLYQLIWTEFALVVPKRHVRICRLEMAIPRNAKRDILLDSSPDGFHAH